MRTFIAAAYILVLTPTAIAADVGVSVTVGQPAFYGRIDIGDVTKPRVIYKQPVIIEQPTRHMEQQPIYLRVPPGHVKHWPKHCHKYYACGQRVYFVKDEWYSKEYVPRYRKNHGEHHERDDREQGDERSRGHGKGHHKD